MRKTLAWPLCLAYVGLVVYASLYPFSGWRDQGVAPWAFLSSPWPPYWTAFDLAANIAGYVPLGFFLGLGLLRGGLPVRATGSRAVVLAVGGAGLLSLLLEGLQTYLPARVPSNVDLALNAAGATVGGLLAALLNWTGGIQRWSQVRAQWFVHDARGALALLALWPFALLFPASVPFGLGQVLERLESTLGEWLADTPFIDWLPLRDVELQPLLPLAELLCVALGLLAPCLLGYCILKTWRYRAMWALLCAGVGAGTTALSAALSWGPAHAWAWLGEAAAGGFAFAAVVAVLTLPLPRRGCAALLLMALVLHLSVLNQAPASAYFTHTLQEWEQGRFIRFNGLAQWLGWLWPYAVMVYTLVWLCRSDSPSKIPP